MNQGNSRRARLADHGAVIAAFLTLVVGTSHAQIPSLEGAPILDHLQRAGLLDDYYLDAVREVAESLVVAAPGEWQGVRVNEAHRPDWLNIYVVDAGRLSEGAPLEVGGIELTREALAGGALADERTGTVHLNTAALKRLAAATRISRGAGRELLVGLATVDAKGLDATRRYWDRSTLDADTDAELISGSLLRGALAFVLAHEMGHLLIGPSDEAEAATIRMQDLANLSEQQKHDRLACPETLHAEYRLQQRHELAADLAAVRLLGPQCRIGEDGELRHGIYQLGTSWYFMAAVVDKWLQVGRSSSINEVDFRKTLGVQLYEEAIAGATRTTRRRGMYAALFPTTHPPDYTRVVEIQRAFADMPCGDANLVAPELLMFEKMRREMCENLPRQTRSP